MSATRIGKILLSSSLGYTVHLNDGTEVLAKRRKGRDIKDGTPMIGDDVELDEMGQIQRFLPRKSVLTRPRMANLDQAAVLISAKQPDFSSFLLDKYLTQATQSQVPAFIVVTKCDLLKTPAEQAGLDKALAWYRALGYSVFESRSGEFKDKEALLSKLRGKVTAFMGQTGVGKSTLSNALDPNWKRAIGRFDDTMGRGKHQTKEVALIPFLGGYIADTPGFSDFRLDLSEADLAEDFPGYLEISRKCRFKGCLHDNVKGCAVIAGVSDGTLSPDSYQNYLKLLGEAKAEKGREKKSSHMSYGKEKRQ